MARKARRRISYVLPLPNSPGGHRLGVNGLAVDTDQSILYSAGRDGVICAWSLGLNLKTSSLNSHIPFYSARGPLASTSSEAQATSTFHKQIQAHTHWVNDIVLTQSNSALVSASSDLTVKAWRPHSEDSQIPTTIGLHSDYVKCLASPGVHSDWVASGGLDHKIQIWDLNGGGEKLHIDVGEHESSAKGSVYALSVRGSIMASGGPESIVRLWDPKSGKRITNFLGHTDNIRDILLNQNGDTVMTASSDQTVKVWSITAGRCMHTLTMHNDSVWSLFSNHPQLSVFYSSDRAGLVAKTDVRNRLDMDEGLSIAIAQEHDGVNKLVVAGDYLWTATSSSSINRWNDVDTKNEVQLPELSLLQRGSSIVSRSMSPAFSLPPQPPMTNGTESAKIPLHCVLRVSNNAIFPGQKPRDLETSTIHSRVSARKPSGPIIDLDQDPGIVLPYHSLPQETIEGQNGLIKHVMLNDRRRVLSLDTAGEVMMWDLLKCIPIKSFGKRHLEDVTPEVNTMESVANWCGVDTRTGRLACVLEENYCFDAETYADELELEHEADFRDDQRINLGKWILRYLFAGLIEEEIERDNQYRRALVNSQGPSSRLRENAPPQIQLPALLLEQQNLLDQHSGNVGDENKPVPRISNGNSQLATTPGLSIGIATPYCGVTNHVTHLQNPIPPMIDENKSLEKRQSQARLSTEASVDYFSSNPQNFPDDHAKAPSTPGEGSAEPVMVDGDKEGKPKEGTTLFGKKFRMNFPKKLSRFSAETKPLVIYEKSEESDKLEAKEDRVVEDSFLGTIQKLRSEYDYQQPGSPLHTIPTGINPPLSNETPLLQLPQSTTIIIQEDRPDSGGVADLYRGTVKSLGQDADQIEKTGPLWLGELLLRNQMPPKETSKVSFFLYPYQDLLPSIASPDGNSRLNANRMLRAKKILAYVAERIEPQPEKEDPNALKPEEYLELYCQNQLVAPTTTLATLRAHIWKNGGDVVLYYKSNDRRPSLQEKPGLDAAEQSLPANGLS